MKRANIFIKIICFVLITVIVFGCAACNSCSGGKEESEDDKEYQRDVQKDDTHVIFDNGATSYQIVLPNNPTSNETYAANELDYFFYLSTSHHLNIVSESHRSSEHYFSIGKTALLDESGIDYDDDELGTSGFQTFTQDFNVYFIGANNGYGCIYAVYDYLEYMIGYKYYAADEFTVDNLSSVPFYHADIKDIPTIQIRTSSSYKISNDIEHATRLRFIKLTKKLIITPHSEMVIMPYAKYKDHTDWYSSGFQHLCYSQEDMKAEYINNLKNMFIDNQEADLVYFGQADINSFCGCSKCRATIGKYGTESAVMILFLNDVVNELNEWLEVMFPERSVKFLLLAYQKTVSAPAVKDKDGNYAPVAPELKLAKNLGVYIADANIDFSQRLDSARNKPRFEILKSWASLSENIWVYTYSLNFHYSFCNFPDYLAFGDNYTTWATFNVEQIYNEGSPYSDFPTFTSLREYLTGKLMWNSNLNFNDTVKEFINAYYKEAAGGMYEYFDALSTWQRHLREIKSGDYGYLYYNYSEAEWPKYVIDGFQTAIKKAYAALEPLKTTDPDKYEKLYNRVKTEELSNIYMYLWLYSEYFTRDEKIQMIDDFEYYCAMFNIVKDQAELGTDIRDTIEVWRAGL